MNLVVFSVVLDSVVCAPTVVLDDGADVGVTVASTVVVFPAVGTNSGLLDLTDSVVAVDSDDCTFIVVGIIESLPAVNLGVVVPAM